jgi:4-hydroxy-3-methylbut-2-enyl diphosphate reductase
VSATAVPAVGGPALLGLAAPPIARAVRLPAPASAPDAAAVAVLGLAAALADDLTPGTLVVADQLLDARGRRATDRLPAAPLISAALHRRGLPARVGPVVSADSLVKEAPPLAQLAATGAVAVDADSLALLAGCKRDRPVTVLRAVADAPASIANWLALQALRAAVPALEDWAAATRPRTVLLAGPRSFCAGVERAVETVERALQQYGRPVYVRRQIVHNRHVVSDLEQRGAVFVAELDQVPDGATVVLSAHGVAPAVRREAAARGFRVVDATCPLVAKVHHEVRRFHERGYQVVLIGHAGHDETEGTLGEAGGIALVEDVEDVASLEVDDPGRLAYVTQTTLSADDVADMVEALSRRFPAIVGPHAADICYATQNRQDAVRAIAPDCDLVLVIGSANSSNGARLVEVATRAGSRAELVEDELDLQLDWLRESGTVGVTAAASTPPAIVDRVVATLGGLGPIAIEERSVRAEHVNFPLPQEVR